MWKGYQYYAFTNKSNEINNASYATETLIKNKVKVTIYYEALCSDSRNFILKQLVPTYNDLRGYIDLDFVPYGKAKTIEKDGVITFKCQHAALECQANKVHACSLVYIKDPDLQLQYIACMIKDNMMPYEIGEKCAKNLGIVYDSISNCAHTDEASLLLKQYGVRTQATKPKIGFIPTIELDDQQSVPLVRILKNFKKELCNKLNLKLKTCL
ncbi:hypothetical protein RN001_015619 [Aquatica leii]|uniref:Uncharacterized protein n=1 Tax=Aquatica leii TaxID=1421715 RepID=A0AAN7NTI1_9COLE|nr:hypothetical protein RN001_015619 [Aquatica leii]